MQVLRRISSRQSVSTACETFSVLTHAQLRDKSLYMHFCKHALLKTVLSVIINTDESAKTGFLR